MSSWIYCNGCDTGLDAPTQRQILMHDYDCPSCGYDHSEFLSDDLLREALVNLLERVEELEKNDG